MTTAHHGSEDALADLALNKVKNAAEAHVVIGGLGMGFTLAAVLRLVGEKGKVIVAELVPKVVEWNKGPGCLRRTSGERPAHDHPCG